MNERLCKRNRAIWWLRQVGWKTTDIASVFHLSPQRIRRIAFDESFRAMTDDERQFEIVKDFLARFYGRSEFFPERRASA